MPKLIVSIDGVVIKEVQLTKERTTLGRRPYNDVVIDNRAVSGEHAAVVLADDQVLLEDLNSTNGTYVNSRAIRQQALQHNDLVEIGKYKIKFLNPGVGASAGAAAARAQAPAVQRRTLDAAAAADLGKAASIRVISGAASGREVALVKVVTTLGKPGVTVAAITRQAQGYVIAHMDGSEQPLLNGDTVSSTPVGLKNGDILQLAGTQMQFIHQG